MDTTVDKQLSVLQNKLQQLLEQYNTLKKENELLKKDIEKSKQVHLSTYNNFVNLKLENKEALEKKIDKYLQEIDRCLLLLNVSV
jgi:transcription termination factor NusB